MLLTNYFWFTDHDIPVVLFNVFISFRDIQPHFVYYRIYGVTIGQKLGQRS